jgi:stage IV sporulation protein FA
MLGGIMENLETIKRKEKRKKYLNKEISKLLLSVIFVFSSLIFMNLSDNNKELYNKYVFNDDLAFTKVNNLYTKYFGNVIPNKNAESLVSNEVITLKDSVSYLDGESFKVGNGSVIKNITNGIVVYIGDKEGYGKSIIVQGADGTNILYGNITDISVNLYDYIEKNTILGNTLDDNLYLLIKKDDKVIKYADYQG